MEFGATMIPIEMQSLLCLQDGPFLKRDFSNLCIPIESARLFNRFLLSE